MQSNIIQINFSVPDTPESLTRAAALMATLAGVSTELRGGFVAATVEEAVTIAAPVNEPAALAEDVSASIPSTAPTMFPADTQGTPAPVEKLSDRRVDCNGVPFDPAFCSGGGDPFYTAGKHKGQWKKKRGVDEDDFYDWYQDSIPAEAEAVQAPVQQAPVQQAPAAASVWGVPGAAMQAAAPQVATLDNGHAVVVAADLMQWVTERQANGRLVPADLEAAFSEAGITVPQLWGSVGTPNHEGFVANLVARLLPRVKAAV